MRWRYLCCCLRQPIRVQLDLSVLLLCASKHPDTGLMWEWGGGNGRAAVQAGVTASAWLLISSCCCVSPNLPLACEGIMVSASLTPLQALCAPHYSFFGRELCSPVLPAE